MITTTRFLILLISMTYLSSLTYAEEPFIGLGAVVGQYDQDSPGTDNDADASPESYKLTIGSRIYKNAIIEAYYLHTMEKDTIELGGANTPVDIEFDFIFGASINWAGVAGPFTFYAGPNISAAKITATSDNQVLQDANTFSTQISPGFGVGIDVRLHKHFSVDFHGETYLYDSDKSAMGFGAQLRYHL